MAFTSNQTSFSCADSLYSAGNYKLAALEYERLFFYSNDEKIKDEALLKKSYCYKSSGNYEKAAQTLQRIDISDASDSAQFNIRYEHALDCFLYGNYDETENILMQIDYYTKNKNLSKTCIYLGILCKNELNKWSEADSLFNIYLKIKNISITSDSVNKLLMKPHLLNPKTAKIISFIIPGSGQIYTGHVFRGISSLILNGSFAYYTYFSFKNKFYLSGIITGFGVFQMLYFGGARYAFYLAEKENAKKIMLYNSKIREFILKNEKPNL